jgi:hypothetical protein
MFLDVLQTGMVPWVLCSFFKCRFQQVVVWLFSLTTRILSFRLTILVQIPNFVDVSDDDALDTVSIVGQPDNICVLVGWLTSSGSGCYFLPSSVMPSGVHKSDDQIYLRYNPKAVQQRRSYVIVGKHDNPSKLVIVGDHDNIPPKLVIVSFFLR